ncbi:MAG: DEAD/DEAH box helicase, partial [Tannerellaceae bacterium]
QDEYRQKLLSKHYPNGKLNKDLLHATLYPYQEEGILFAAKAGRTLIADEMGLGKTLQAIGTAELLQKEMRISSVLIICPTSLKYQWEAEIKRFTDNNVKVIEGSAIKRREQYSEFYKIVSYNSAANDISQLVQFGFDMVILDEAQRIKNWKTQIAQAVKKLMPDYTVVLTGTPLENKLEELYSIVQYIDPYRLGPYYKFLNQYQITTDNGQVIGYKDLHAVSNKLDGLLIRRRKRDVQIQLPGRMDKILYVPLTTEQADIHEEHKQTVARLVLKWRHNRFLSENDRKRLLLSLTQMRMVSDSTYIQDQKTRFDTKIGELMNILHEVFENGDEKVVIFSQWERMTRLVAYELEKEGVGYEYLHGSIPSKDRKRLIENFNRPECRVFLSTDAGSTGLNLQAASLIINLDIPWNPAVLEQRIARIHRMGQKNAISVINFVSRGSIEEQMLDKLTFKSNLFEGVLDNGQDSIFINESKFSELMNTVEDITKTIEPSTSIDQEELESNAQATPERATEPSTSPTVEEEEEETSVDESLVEPFAELEKETSTPPVDKPAPEQLVQTGLQFISGLAQALSTPESTQQLVASLVEEDKETGKTCLKIPVESRESVEKLFGLFGKLFAGGK